MIALSKINETATVPYSPAEMFRLVNDIESYPKIFPWCADAKILQRDENQLTAMISLASGKLRHSLTTRNTMQPDRMIDMRLVEGPFRKLEGSWEFLPQGDNGCSIRLSMDFEFKNKLLKYALEGLFNRIVSSLVDSFIARSEQVYGKRR